MPAQPQAALHEQQLDAQSVDDRNAEHVGGAQQDSGVSLSLYTAAASQPNRAAQQTGLDAGCTTTQPQPGLHVQQLDAPSVDDASAERAGGAQCTTMQPQPAHDGQQHDTGPTQLQHECSTSEQQQDTWECASMSVAALPATLPAHQASCNEEMPLDTERFKLPVCTAANSGSTIATGVVAQQHQQHDMQPWAASDAVQHMNTHNVSDLGQQNSSAIHQQRQHVQPPAPVDASEHVIQGTAAGPGRLQAIEQQQHDMQPCVPSNAVPAVTADFDAAQVPMHSEQDRDKLSECTLPMAAMHVVYYPAMVPVPMQPHEQWPQAVGSANDQTSCEAAAYMQQQHGWVVYVPAPQHVQVKSKCM